MVFIWNTIRSGRAGARSGDRNKFETFAWLIPDKTEAWEFQEDIPMVFRDRVVPDQDSV